MRAENDVVLACGCITSPYGAVKELGSAKKEEQLCPKEHGWQVIKREATLYERFAFHEFGLSAAKRRNSKSSEQVLTMLRGDKSTSGWARPENGVLF